MRSPSDPHSLKGKHQRRLSLDGLTPLLLAGGVTHLILLVLHSSVCQDHHLLHRKGFLLFFEWVTVMVLSCANCCFSVLQFP